MTTAELPEIGGVAHYPDAEPSGVVVLTHGAGGSRHSTMLRLLCTAWAQRGWLAIRFDMPFRRRRVSGPPSAASAGKDREGIAEAIELARSMVDGPVLAGGHSYGGRQTSMLVAERGPIVDALTIFSYPLHPPGKPDRLRTEHFSAIQTPTVFTQGASDAFGTIDELRAAAALIPAGAVLVEIAGARHDLNSKTLDVPTLAIDAALKLSGLPSRGRRSH